MKVKKIESGIDPALYEVGEFVVQIIHGGEITINLFKEGKVVEHMRLHSGHFMEQRSDEIIATYAVNRFMNPVLGREKK